MVEEEKQFKGGKELQRLYGAPRKRTKQSQQKGSTTLAFFPTSTFLRRLFCTRTCQRARKEVNQGRKETIEGCPRATAMPNSHNLHKGKLQRQATDPTFIRLDHGRRLPDTPPILLQEQVRTNHTLRGEIQQHVGLSDRRNDHHGDMKGTLAACLTFFLLLDRDRYVFSC